MFSDHNGIKLEISKISGLPRYLGIKHFKKKNITICVLEGDGT